MLSTLYFVASDVFLKSNFVLLIFCELIAYLTYLIVLFLKNM